MDTTGYSTPVLGDGAYLYTDTTFNQSVTPDTVPTDILMQSAPVTSTPPNDPFSGWLKGTADTLLSYSLKKDAAQTASGLRTQATPAQTLALAQQRQTGMNSTVLLIGAAVVAVVVLSK